jgi:hypothetical protein
MFNEIVRGSVVAFVLWALSLIGLYARLVPTYYFATALGAWMLYALYRVFLLFSKRSATSSPDHSRRDALAYWLAPVGSSLFVPLLWILIVSHIKVF